MKRLIVALLVGGMVFGTVLGVAASLGVNGGFLQAGTDDSLECDGEGVTLKWKTMVTQADFRVAGVEVYDIDAACIGGKVLIALQSAPGSQVGFARGDIVADDSEAMALAHEFYSGGAWVNGESGVGPKVADVNLVSVLIKNAWVSYDAP
jgi:hypothetical protein